MARIAKRKSRARIRHRAVGAHSSARHHPAIPRNNSTKSDPAQNKRVARKTGASSTELLHPDKGPELVFGLIGPVGTDLGLVIEVLEERLQLVGYGATTIRLARLLDDVPGLVDHEPEALDDYYKTYMDAGNEFRRKMGRNDALTLLSILRIQNARRKLTGDPQKPAPRHAYVLRSLKHHEEVQSLRKLYGRAFYLIGAYAPRIARIELLAKQIAASYHDTSKAKYRSKAEGILTRDEHEEEIEGQHVRSAFPLSDIFIDATSRQSILDGLSRFIDLVFSHPFLTPSHDEFAMYLAQAASLRSSDLSRQVGAVVTTADADVIGVGCNEVPKAFGGQYWEGNTNDNRDWRLGYDPSARMKIEILREVLGKLQKRDWFSPEKTDAPIEDLAEAARKDELSGTQFMDSIEYGRIVHAEMAAIIDAARRGNALEGAVLYSTTFPCHMCARHIVGAGIRRVVFIEPYPKSKVEELYSDLIVVEGGRSVSDRVVFSPFVGVAPSRFPELFEIRKRKLEDGQILKWERAKSSPRLEQFVQSYIFLETKVADTFGSAVSNQFEQKRGKKSK